MDEEQRAEMGGFAAEPSPPNKHVGWGKAWGSVASLMRGSGKPPVSVHLSALENALLECASSTSMLVDLHSFCSQEDGVIFVIFFCLGFFCFFFFFTIKSY